MPTHRLSQRATAFAAIAALAFAYAVVVQASGPNQAAHFALVRALADGTAEIDPRETIDAAYIDGRFYAAKAPGLAMFTLPWYGLPPRRWVAGLRRSARAGYTRRLWEVNLFGAVLPTLALLLLVAVRGRPCRAGALGAPTAVLLGAGSLLLPFSTLFFDHALSAALGFAAFVVLLRTRRPGRRRRRTVRASWPGSPS